MFGRRKQSVAVPEVGGEAPKFQLPSAQGGQLQLSMRTVRGPVVVVFYRPWSEEDIGYFEALAAKEDEINMVGGSVVGIGVAEAGVAREFVRASGIKSYVLYDYAKVTSRQWGLLEKDKEHGDYSRPAVFVVGTDHEVAHAWVGERPQAEQLLAKVSEITGLPRSAEEPPRPKEGPERGKSEASPGTARKLTAEERERIKAERRAAREAGKSVKTGEAAEKGGEKAAEKEQGDTSGSEKPKKMSAEERERIKAERRAAREAGKSLKTPRKEPQDSGSDAEKKEDQSAKAEDQPQAGEARVQAEVDADSGDGSEEQRDSLPEGAETGEQREKQRAEE